MKFDELLFFFEGFQSWLQLATCLPETHVLSHPSSSSPLFFFSSSEQVLGRKQPPLRWARRRFARTTPSPLWKFWDLSPTCERTFVTQRKITSRWEKRRSCSSCNNVKARSPPKPLSLYLSISLFVFRLLTNLHVHKDAKCICYPFSSPVKALRASQQFAHNILYVYCAFVFRCIKQSPTTFLSWLVVSLHQMRSLQVRTQCQPAKTPQAFLRQLLRWEPQNWPGSERRKLLPWRWIWS